jgi:hypothetical protein
MGESPMGVAQPEEWRAVNMFEMTRTGTSAKEAVPTDASRRAPVVGNEPA